MSFDGRRVLVTGGAGFVGRRLVAALRAQQPAVIRVFDNSEDNLWAARTEFGDDGMRYIMADVRDAERVASAMREIDIIFHLAARKHVFFTNYAPQEAIDTNVLGTLNVVKAALAGTPETVVNMSTDKACAPLNLYGTTKRLGEFIADWGHRIAKGKRFVSVRSGNFLWSDGSVLPTWHRQASRGEPLTITNPEMCRFVMTARQAVDLLLSAAERAPGGATVIGKGATASVRRLHAAFCAHYDHVYPDVTVGAQPGEKLHEDLMLADESVHRRDDDGAFVLHPSFPTATPLHYSTRDAPLATKAELLALVREDAPPPPVQRT